MDCGGEGMKKRTVKREEIEDFDFEQIVLSSGQKRLSVYVHPANVYMHFKVYFNLECVTITGSFTYALDEYNKL